MRIDLHRHLWTAPLLAVLAQRSARPRVVVEGDRAVLHSADEHPYTIDLATQAPDRRPALVERDGLDLAIIALSSPIGVEALPSARQPT